MRKVALGLAAVAAVAFSGSAMATPLPATGQVNGQNYGVPVNITVEPNVSVWAGPAVATPVALDMNGADGNNSATAAANLYYLNNVDAKIDVRVDGTLPAPIVPGGGINFFIFKNSTPVAAVAAITSNAYNPSGALVWTNATIGTSTNLINPTGVNTSAATMPIVYASDAPGELPLANTYNLVVTYTISALP